MIYIIFTPLVIGLIVALLLWRRHRRLQRWHIDLMTESQRVDLHTKTFTQDTIASKIDDEARAQLQALRRRYDDEVDQARRESDAQRLREINHYDSEVKQKLREIYEAHQKEIERRYLDGR